MSETMKKSRMSVALWLLSLLGFASGIDAQSPPAKTPIDVGEVTARDVYVRSGASQNHYPVCKLQPGDRVSIVSEQGEWYEIVPPKESYGLISGEYVDTVDNENGVINGDNVRVRTGSSLSDQKYTIQAILGKGAKVRILGRNEDGFLRVEPPPTATLWIHRTFVERMSEARLKLDAEGVERSPDAGPLSSTAGGSRAIADASPGRTLESMVDVMPNMDKVSDSKKETSLASTSSAGTSSTPSGLNDIGVPNRKSEGRASSSSLEEIPSSLAELPPTPQRRALERAEQALAAEVGKSAEERNLEPALAGFRMVADQTEDDMARQYASARVAQLSQMAELVATIKQIQSLSDETDIQRRKITEERADAGFKVVPGGLTGFDAQGELRVSALYPAGTVPRRYRLVDPSKGNGQTVAYVELPQDSPVQVEAYLGRYVGVQASEKRLQVGGVNPVPVLIVREIRPLDPAGATEKGDGKS